MTTDDPRPPELRCPSCGATLGAALPPWCPACAVPVGGATGRRILALDQRIASLAVQRADLLVRLRREAAPVPPAPVAARSWGPAAGARPTPPPPPAARPRADGPVRRWLAAAGPQTLLAAGGVLLLAIAAIVFTAVTWRDLPMVARGGVLLAAAGGSAHLTAALVRRELIRTAEATGVLTIAMLGVLADGLWSAGLFEPLADTGVIALCAAVLAVLAHALARVVGVRSPLVLTAWLAGIAVHAAAVWLTDPYAAIGGTEVDVLVVLAVDLVAVLVAGGYAARVLTVLPRWRAATLGATALLWLATAVGAPVVLIALAPSTSADVPPFLLGLLVVGASVAVAAAARRVSDLSGVGAPAVGTAGMWFAATLGVAGALSNRLGAWPDMAVVTATVLGIAGVAALRSDPLRSAATVGMAPVLLAALVPVISLLDHVPGMADGSAAVRPDAVLLGSALLVTAATTGLAALLDRLRPVAGLVAVGAWTTVVVAASVGAAALAPSVTAARPAFAAHLAVLAAVAALAAAAGRVGLLPRAGAWAAVTFALSAGMAGVLWDRLAAWPQLPLVVPLVAGALLLHRLARPADRAGVAVGLAPALLAGAGVVLPLVVWVAEVLSDRVAAPWPPVVVHPWTPDGALIASAAVISTVAAASARRLGRSDVALVVLGAAGAPVLVAAGVAVWPTGGAAVVGSLLVVAAVVGVRARPDLPGVPVLAVATAVAVAAGLTAPAITIATLTVTAGVTAAALGVRLPSAATAVAWLVAADLIGLAAAVAAAATRDDGVVGLAVTCAAALGWTAAAATRRHRHHALGVELASGLAFGVGIPLAGARGLAWLGAAFAVLAVASAAVAVWRDDRRWMQWVAAAAASASSWSVLADAGVETVEAFTAPPALLLIGLAALRLRARPDASSWPVLGSGLGLLTMPTLAQLVDDPGDLARLAAAVVLGALLVVAGRRWALQAPVAIGVTVSAVAALTQYAVLTDVVPRWMLLAAGGALLLWLSISYEAQRRRLATARRHLVAMR